MTARTSAPERPLEVIGETAIINGEQVWRVRVVFSNGDEATSRVMHSEREQLEYAATLMEEAVKHGAMVVSANGKGPEC